jgi:hypothetical protein
MNGEPMELPQGFTAGAGGAKSVEEAEAQKRKVSAAVHDCTTGPMSDGRHIKRLRYQCQVIRNARVS